MLAQGQRAVINCACKMLQSGICQLRAEAVFGVKVCEFGLLLQAVQAEREVASGSAEREGGLGQAAAGDNLKEAAEEALFNKERSGLPGIECSVCLNRPVQVGSKKTLADNVKDKDRVVHGTESRVARAGCCRSVRAHVHVPEVFEAATDVPRVSHAHHPPSARVRRRLRAA